MKSKKTKLVLADDHELMRKALISLLEENPLIDVIGEASNGKELLSLLKTIKPDVILLDIEMPVMNGRETLVKLKKRFPDTGVIILSMYDESSLVTDFMTLGANAFISKSEKTDVLFKAIKAVKTEGIYFDNKVSKSLLKTLLREKGINPHFDELALSPREYEILKQVCTGKTNNEIGEEVGISPNTVDFHRKNIYRKTKSSNLADLVKYAIKNAIISLE